MRRANINTIDWGTPVGWRMTANETQYYETADEAHRYETANEGFVTLRQMADMIEAQREQEHMIETLLQERDEIRRAYENFIEVPHTSGVTLLGENDYFRMEWEWRLDPSITYYTYSDSDDWLESKWIERHPKKEIIAYFIN